MIYIYFSTLGNCQFQDYNYQFQDRNCQLPDYNCRLLIEIGGAGLKILQSKDDILHTVY